MLSNAKFYKIFTLVYVQNIYDVNRDIFDHNSDYYIHGKIKFRIKITKTTV